MTKKVIINQHKSDVQLPDFVSELNKLTRLHNEVPHTEPHHILLGMQIFKLRCKINEFLIELQRHLESLKSDIKSRE